MRCAEDEDVIYDPYVVTKWINKLRMFYILKQQIQTNRFQKKLSEAEEGYSNLKNVHLRLQEYIQKEQMLKGELMKLQDDLNNLQRQYDSTVVKLETHIFEKKKIIKQCDDQAKRISILED